MQKSDFHIFLTRILCNILLLGESISRGAFGIVRFAEAHDPTFGLDGLGNRTCVIKTLYLRRRFDAMLKAGP